MKKLFGIIVILCVFGVPEALAVEGSDILGSWVTEGGGSRIEIYKTGSNLYSGKIVALREPDFLPGEVEGMDEKPRLDVNNPDESLRDRPLLGLEFIKGFSFNGEEWVGGEIYDPETGYTYKSKISLAKDGSLHVRGYIGISWFGRTTVWYRDDVYIKSLCKTLSMFDVNCSK